MIALFETINDVIHTFMSHKIPISPTYTLHTLKQSTILLIIVFHNITVTVISQILFNFVMIDIWTITDIELLNFLFDQYLDSHPDDV